VRDEIITLGILFLLMGFFVFTSHTINSGSKKLSQAIQKAEDAAYNSDDAKEEFEKAKKVWQKEKKALFYICGHSMIMDIDENMELGCEYIKDGDEEKAVLLFKKAQILLKDLTEREKIRLDNIF